jgi:hypothetical protein
MKRHSMQKTKKFKKAKKADEEEMTLSDEDRELAYGFEMRAWGEPNPNPYHGPDAELPKGQVNPVPYTPPGSSRAYTFVSAKDVHICKDEMKD